jgi:hypothetical protein
VRSGGWISGGWRWTWQPRPETTSTKMGVSMTPDQKLATARIYATLAVAQELPGDEPAQ